MAYCKNCGEHLPEGTSFCGYCGAHISGARQTVIDEAAQIKEEQEFLDSVRRVLNWEYKAWSIGSRVYLFMGVLYAVMYFLMGMAVFTPGAEAVENLEAIEFFIFAVTFAIIYGLCGIIGTVMKNKLPVLIDCVYDDLRAVAVRCTSVGKIVAFYLLQNPVSLIFYIVNFVKFKSCQKIVGRIIDRQSKARNERNNAI